jgi:hypothetical protein
MKLEHVVTPTKFKIELMVETHHSNMMPTLEKICKVVSEEFRHTHDEKNVEVIITPTVTFIYPEEEKCSI